jgi:surfactin synthase thioesterase subunit
MSTSAHLICFHHAGGASTAFRRLIRALGPGVRVTAVNLPGRESRVNERRHRDVRACAEQLADELSQLLDQPHVLLGHSMGALVAYTIAQHRIAGGHRSPEALIVANYAAPNLPSAAGQIDAADDLQLATSLSHFGGLPAELLTRPDWLAALMPLVRDDLRICASHQDRGEPPLPCPVYVFGGDADPLVPSAALAEWRRHTTQPGPVTIIPGGHFLFRHPHPALVSAIGAIVAAHSVEAPQPRSACVGRPVLRRQADDLVCSGRGPGHPNPEEEMRLVS